MNLLLRPMVFGDKGPMSQIPVWTQQKVDLRESDDEEIVIVIMAIND